MAVILRIRTFVKFDVIGTLVDDAKGGGEERVGDKQLTSSRLLEQSNKIASFELLNNIPSSEGTNDATCCTVEPR